MSTRNQKLKLQMEYDGKHLTSGLKGSTGELVEFGRKGQSATAKTRRGLNSVASQLDRTKSQIFSAGAAWASWEGIKVFKSLIDDQTNLRTAISRTINSQDQFNQRQQTLLDLANRTRSEMGSTVNLFVKLREPMQSFGRDTQDTLKFIELFQKSLKKYPTTAQQASASTTQLAQALGSNNFAGDEFKSLAENAQGFMEALRDGVGVVTGATNLTIADLKRMGSEGQLTTELVTAALLTQSQKINDNFNSAERTIDDALVRIKNNISTRLGNLDADIGLGAGLRDAIDAVSDNLNGLANAATAAFALIVARKSGATASMIANWARETAANRASTAAQIKNNLAVAKSEQTKAAAALHMARVAKSAAVATVAAARADLRAATTTAQYTAALNALTAAQARNRAASVALSGARLRGVQTTNAMTAATARASLASRGLAVTTGVLNGALALVGGPAGLFVLAAGSALVYREEIMRVISRTGQATTRQEQHTAVLNTATSMAYDYADATAETRIQLDKQRVALIDNARALIKKAEIEAAVTKTRLDNINALREANRDVSPDPESSHLLTNDAEEADYKAVQANLKSRQAHLQELKKTLALMGKTKAQIDKSLAKRASRTKAPVLPKIKLPGIDQGSQAAFKRYLQQMEVGNLKLRGLGRAAEEARLKHLGFSAAQRKVALSLYDTKTALEKKRAALKQADAAAKKSRKKEIKAADDVNQAIQQEIRAAQDKINKLSMSAEAYERARLKAIGFRGALLEETLGLWRTKNALEAKAEATEKARQKSAAAQQQAQDDARQLKQDYDELRKSNALKLAVLNSTGAAYLKLEIGAKKYSQSQKIILLQEAVQIRNAEKLKQIRERAGEQKLSLDYQINVQDGALTEDQQRIATDKAAVAFERAKLKAQGYSAAVVDLAGKELTAIQIKQRLIQQQQKVADIVRQANAEILDQHNKVTMLPEAYERWKLTSRGVSKATADNIIALRKLNTEISNQQRFYDGLGSAATSNLNSISDVFKNMSRVIQDEAKRMVVELLILKPLLGAKTAGGGRDGGLLGDIFGSIFGTSTAARRAASPGAIQAKSASGAVPRVLAPAGDVQVTPVTNVTVNGGQAANVSQRRNDTGGQDINIDLITQQIEGNIVNNARNNRAGGLQEIFERRRA